MCNSPLFSLLCPINKTPRYFIKSKFLSVFQSFPVANGIISASWSGWGSLHSQSKPKALTWWWIVYLFIRCPMKHENIQIFSEYTKKRPEFPFFFRENIELSISALLKFLSARCEIFLIVCESNWIDSVTDFIAPNVNFNSTSPGTTIKMRAWTTSLLCREIRFGFHVPSWRGASGYSDLTIRSGHGDKFFT